MTVSYNLDIASVNAISFVKLLFRWRGSIWKSVKTELFIFIFAYYIVLVCYRFLLNSGQREAFGRFARHCDEKLNYIPLTFMLGFFVTVVVDRWRQIFQNMGWIENVALTISTLFQGNDTDSILQRRTIIRYLVLSQILVYRDISMRVRRRFPNLESIVVAGFMQEHELQSLEKIEISYNKYWVPINWALNIVADGHKEKKIEAAPSMNNIIGEIRNFRTNLALLCNYDWVPIPIAYPQVVFLAVRVYFFICLFSRQYIIEGSRKTVSVIDLYVPFMTILQFIFFVGWMKVAEVLLNPLGEDDDDFEVNFLIDKNLATGMAIVDSSFDDRPAMLPDSFMNKKYIPIYSEESTKTGISQGLVGSVEGVQLAKPHDDVKMVAVSPVQSMSDLSGLGDDTSHLSMSMRLRRRFSSGLSGRKKFRTHSIEPMNFGESLPASFNFGQAKADSKLGQMFQVSNSTDRPNRIQHHHLSKVDEESGSKWNSLDYDEDEKQA